MKCISREIIRELITSEEFKSTGDITEAIKAMFSDVLGEVLEAELDTTLGYDKQERRPGAQDSGKPRNYRNGHTTKTVKTHLGEVEIAVPRDRNGEFEPKIIGKYSRNAEGMEEKILGLYAAEMSKRDIAEQIKTLYRVKISPELVSKISEKILPQIAEWPIHQIRSISRFIGWKDIKALVAGLKAIYGAATEDEAFANLTEFNDTWGKKYPSGARSREDN